jgi:hypothetical protein
MFPLYTVASELFYTEEVDYVSNCRLVDDFVYNDFNI